MKKISVRQHSRVGTDGVKEHSRTLSDVSMGKSQGTFNKTRKFPKDFKKRVSFVDAVNKNVKLNIQYYTLGSNSEPHFSISGSSAGSSGQVDFVPKNNPQNKLKDIWAKYHLKANIPKNLENQIDRIIEDIEDAESDNQDDLGLSGWKLTAMKELAEESDEVFTDVEDNGDNINLTGAGEYIVFKNYDDAESYAKDRLYDDLEENPEYFNHNFLLGHIDERKARRFFEDVYSEMDTSYANDIMSEGSSNGYENRLVDELVEMDIITESQAEEKGFDGEDYIDDLAEKMTEEKLDEGTGGYEYYESNFGDEEARKIALDNNLIDSDDVVEDAIRSDGVGHYIAGYDGNEIELPSGAYAYRN